MTVCRYTEKMMSSGTVCFSDPPARELFCYVVAAHEESFHSQICNITNSQNNVSVGLNPFTLGHFVHAMIKSRGDNVD